MFSDTLGRAVAVARSLCEANPPESLSGEEAARTAEQLAAGEKLFGSLKVSYAARVEETGSYTAGGYRSAAAYLGAISGAPEGQAKAALGTEKLLAKSPSAKRAYRAGELSGAEAAEVARVAGSDEEATETLLAKAADPKVGYGQLRREAERAAQAARSAEDDRARDARIHAGRFVRFRKGFDGGVRGEMALDDVEGAKVIARVRGLADRLWRVAARHGTPEAKECYMADAMVGLILGDYPSAAGSSGKTQPPAQAPAGQEPAGPQARPGGAGAGAAPGAAPAPATGAAGSRRARASEPEAPAAASPHPSAGPRATGAPDPAPAPEGDDSGPGAEWCCDEGCSDPAGVFDDEGCDDEGCDRAEERPSDDQSEAASAPAAVRAPDTHVHLHLSVESLTRGSVQAGERCEIAGLGPISLAQAHHLLCDASYHLLIDNGIDVYRISRASRRVTAAQQRAILSRDPTCVVPNCEMTLGLQIHHWRVEYQGGIGKTELANLCALCTQHHSMIHHQGWVISGGPGKWSFDREQIPGTEAAQSEGRGAARRRDPSKRSRPRSTNRAAPRDESTTTEATEAPPERPRPVPRT